MLAVIWGYIVSNPEISVPAALAVAEAITRLTPTDKDDGFVKRIGSVVDLVFNAVKFPNRLK